MYAHYIALLTISPAQGDIVGREYIKLSGVTSVAPYPCQTWIVEKSIKRRLFIKTLKHFKTHIKIFFLDF
jgi:hypothetical protein